MRVALIAGLLATLCATGIATNGTHVAPTKQWARVNLTVPTRLGDQVLLGQYLIVHDDARMAKGEPCTAVYRFDPSRGPQERLVEFMCIPHHAEPATTVQLTVERERGISNAARVVLVGYQFSGDAEVHGVPQRIR